MENFMNKIKGLLSKTEPSVLGVDIGSSSIKVVQLKRKHGKAVLETYGELALGPYSDLEIGRATNLPAERLIAAVTDLLRESNTTTKKCGVAIPIGSSLITLIELPTVSTSEFASMIPIEARKYIPVPISEVTLDWWTIPTEKTGIYEGEGEHQKGDKSEVLVVAIHNEIIAKYQEIVKQTGLQTSFIELEIFSTIRAVLDNMMGTAMIFDMGASSTKLYIVERGIVHSSHTINRGSQDITIALSTSLGITVAEAENIKRGFGSTRGQNEKEVFDVMSLTMEYIFAEANRTMFNYQKKYGRNIAKVVLTGGGVGYKGLLELARMNLQTNVELGDPFSKVEYPAFLEEVLRQTGPEFSVAVGVALRRLQEIG